MALARNASSNRLQEVLKMLPLHYAVEHGNSEIVQAVLADIRELTNNDRRKIFTAQTRVGAWDGEPICFLCNRLSF